MRVLTTPGYSRDDVKAAIARIQTMDHRRRAELLDSIDTARLSPAHHAALFRVLRPPRAGWR